LLTQSELGDLKLQMAQLRSKISQSDQKSRKHTDMIYESKRQHKIIELKHRELEDCRCEIAKL